MENAKHIQLQEQTLRAEQLGMSQLQEDMYRLRLHLMPPIGWLNDPNGLCQFRGVYHIFFQYSPLDPQGGMKAWGHYTSKDLLNWTYEGTPFFPDEDYDRDGVYSGSAFIENDKMYLYYTGNVKLPGDYNYITDGREANTILITSEDGTTFSKKMQLMTNEDYPENYTCHIRDPKVWKKENVYYMIQGGRRIDNQGTVLLFCSEDLMHWKFYKEVTTEHPFGYMWECPDYFQLLPDGESAYQDPIDILSVSPQGLEKETFRFQNVYQSGYFQALGDLTQNGKMTDFVEWDQGFDFYAPQTFEDTQGRRLLVGWAGIPDADYDNAPTIERGWQHALTVPRELRWTKGKVYQSPINELKQLRQNQQKLESGKCLEIQSTVAYDFEIEGIDSQDFLLTLSEENQENGLALAYTGGILQLEFYGDRSKRIGRGRERRQNFVAQLDQVRILIDTSLVEIYINQGEYVLTTRYYISSQKMLCVKCENSVSTLYPMRGYSYQKGTGRDHEKN